MPDDLVGRARLDTSYRSATGRVLRVLAPGGYGKSTLVARWVGDDDRVVCWVDLEPIHDDPAALLSALTDAVESVPDLAFDTLPRGPMTGDALRDVMPFRLGQLLRRCGTPFVLVLDDIQHLHRDEARTLVDAIADHLPSSSTLVLSGRGDRSDLSIGRLRLAPGVVDVGVADLALTVAESLELLCSMGVDGDQDDLEGLAARLEGWPAGLRLAGLVLLDGAERVPTSAEQVDDTTFIVEYLRSEWTGRLCPEDLTLLREAAVLERFTGEMCDSVLGRTGSAVDLRRLLHDELIVLPLDRRDEWFRMHAVLTRWLSNDLRDLDRARWRDIHLAAARHWADGGDADLAVRHAAAAGDLGLCERLVTEHAGRYYTMGLRMTVQRWLDLFSTEQLTSSVPLCAIGTLNALHGGDGRRALQWSRMIGRDGAVAGEAPGTVADGAGVALWGDVLWASLEQRPAEELVERLQHALPRIGALEWRGLACWALGGALFLLGDGSAIECLDQGEFWAQLAGAPLLRANCLASGSVVADWAGDDAAAERRLYDARRIVADLRMEHAPTAAVVLSMSARVAARQGRRDVAAHEAEIARTSLRGFDTVSPWFNVLTRLALVPAALQLDEPRTAQRLLHELEHHVGLDPTARGAASCVAQLRDRVDVALRVALSPDALTPAERRVLEYLPTNLSLTEIATRLFVSRNTVKSHASAIYRKLDATSRSRAVDIARAAGLLDDHPPRPPP